MRIAITGAGGQLGRAMLAQVPPGVTAVPLDRGACDLLEPATIDRAIAESGAEAIVNCAAYTAVDKAESEPERAFAVNADGVARLAEAAERSGARLVQISTDFVFDGSQGRPYRPGDKRNPLSVYGRSKAGGEDAAGPNAAILRTGWVYSSGSGNFATTMLRLMKERGQVSVVADQVGCPTHAVSLARAAWALATRGDAGTYHYSDAGAASWYDFACAIAEEGERHGLLAAAPEVQPITTAQFPAAARRPSYSLLDSTETHARLGLAPRHWRAELSSMIEGIATHG